jgi:hypothetical protein
LWALLAAGYVIGFRPNAWEGLGGTMNWKIFKGYVLIPVSGLYLMAAILLGLLNLRNPCDWSMYGTIQKGQSIGGIMFVSAVVGAVGLLMVILLVRGIRDLRRGRREARLERLDKQAQDRPAETPQS